MRYLFSLWLLTCVLTVGALAQQKEKTQVVILPREIAMPVVAHQPDSPLKFEEAMYISYIGGSGGGAYTIANRSSQPIRAYKIATLNSTGTHATRTFEAKTSDQWLLPGQMVPRSQGHSDVEFVPLTDELRQQQKIKNPMKGLVIFMVVRVEFADGTVYSDERTYEALKAFFEENGIIPKSSTSSVPRK